MSFNTQRKFDLLRRWLTALNGVLGVYYTAIGEDGKAAKAFSQSTNLSIGLGNDE